MGNKGFEAAVSAIEMADLMVKLRERASQNGTPRSRTSKASWPATRRRRSYGGLLDLESLEA